MFTRRAFLAGSCMGGLAVLLPGGKVVAYATTTQLKAETDARIKADADLSARISALEAAAAPAPTVAPSTSKVVPFSGTQAEFLSLVADMTVDVIEFAAGTYAWSTSNIRQNRSSRPLTIRPAQGANVTFDLGGASSWMRFGALVGLPGVPTEATSDLTIDATPGSITVQNLNVGKDGVVYGDWMERISVIGLRVRSVSGLGGSYSHCLYVGSDGTHRSKDILALGWGVLLDKTMNFAQTYHNPNVAGLLVKGCTASGGHTFAYVYGDGSNVVYDGNTISAFDRSFESAETVTGTYRNNIATSTGAPSFGAPGFVDGGGNSL